MNMWQIENLSQHQEKCEHQIKKKIYYQSQFYQIIHMDNCRTSNTWSHEKTRGIKKVYMKLTVILPSAGKVRD